MDGRHGACAGDRARCRVGGAVSVRDLRDPAPARHRARGDGRPAAAGGARPRGARADRGDEASAASVATSVDRGAARTGHGTAPTAGGAHAVAPEQGDDAGPVPMRRTAAIAILYAAFTGRVVGAADAQGGDRPGRALFEQAEAKFNVGRFEEALVDYQAAYDVEPLPAFLFNIGQCYRNLGNYERAQFFFRRYTVLDPRSPNRPAADRLIAEMDRLAGEQPGATAAAEQASPTPPLLAAPVPAADV